jgi:hypothetical protein
MTLPIVRNPADMEMHFFCKPHQTGLVSWGACATEIERYERRS